MVLTLPKWYELIAGKNETEMRNMTEKHLDVIYQYGKDTTTCTDLVMLTGGDFKKNFNNECECPYFVGTVGFDSNYAFTVKLNGEFKKGSCSERFNAIRPSLELRGELPMTDANSIKEITLGVCQMEFGEYPQYAPDESMQIVLNSEFESGNLNETKQQYVLAKTKMDPYSRYDNDKYTSVKEYEYQGKKYIQIEANIFDKSKTFVQLANGLRVKDGERVWIEVSPVKWLIDFDKNILISKETLLSGIPVGNYSDYFEDSDMQHYLSMYMQKDLFKESNFLRLKNENINLKSLVDEQVLKRYDEAMDTMIARTRKKENPYGFNFESVSEEDIIKGAVESGVAVFLHGPSSEGKSARVKQIDPTCEIIYLRNATPESLNGKSVYNQSTGEMIDVKPSWLKKVEEKCEKEPDRLHIIFFDEITNALPSIQGIAFNIVLDKEVNGIWKLPENARIVAAGNDVNDSLAANQMAEPLFNRFAHVYIKTTTSSWLKWASKNHIHPAIYSYIAYKNGSTLRSEYNGETPNADPRKWEMASKMLYSTGNPEMLRSLVGEDITEEFIEFCRKGVITLEDVINENYSINDINSLDTAEKYATVMCLSQVDEEHLDEVRSFVSKLGAEFETVFDGLWAHGDDKRLERIMESNLAYSQNKVMIKK